MQCRICDNSENNKIHRAREMMFGMRDEFEYLECAECETVQIAEVPDLSRYYPKDYFSFSSEKENPFSNKLKSRLAAAFVKKFLADKQNFISKYLTKRLEFVGRFYPAYLSKFDLKINFNSRILDFGSGAGHLLQVLHYFGFRNLTGADAFIEKDIFYPNGVKIFKRSLAELEPSFDLIMLHHAFEHLPNPRETLREVYRLLQKDKFCLIRIPIVNFAWKKYGAHWVALDPPRHLFLFTEKSFRRLAESEGFTIEKVIYDSDAFQFWGSEQYMRDIPLNDERSFTNNKNLFTKAQIKDWKKQARDLNAKGAGDQACFYLRRV